MVFFVNSELNEIGHGLGHGLVHDLPPLYEHLRQPGLSDENNLIANIRHYGSGAGYWLSNFWP